MTLTGRNPASEPDQVKPRTGHTSNGMVVIAPRGLRLTQAHGCRSVIQRDITGTIPKKRQLSAFSTVFPFFARVTTSDSIALER